MSQMNKTMNFMLHRSEYSNKEFKELWTNNIQQQIKCAIKKKFTP